MLTAIGLIVLMLLASVIVFRLNPLCHILQNWFTSIVDRSATLYAEKYYPNFDND